MPAPSIIPGSIESYQIKNRWTGEVQFTAELTCSPYTLPSIKLGLAVKAAVKAGANLADANLTDANFTGANLAGANLTGANLTGANFTGANLTGANLTDANLADANLTDANFTGANLTDANLTDANFTGANLTDANLADARWTNGITLQKRPIQIYGLAYRVTILDAHAQIGCQLKTLAEWEALEEADAKSLDGRAAADLFKCCRDALLSLARAAGRSFDPPAAPAEAPVEEIAA